MTEGKKVLPRKRQHQIFTTMQAMAYLQSRRTKCQPGDFIISNNELYVITDPGERFIVCWRIRSGQKVYRATFNKQMLQAISPLEGFFGIDSEQAEALDWPVIIAEIQSFAERNPCPSEWIVVPITTP